MTLNNDDQFTVGILHISYAPEYETIADVRQKFAARKNDVTFRMAKLQQQTDSSEGNDHIGSFHAKRPKRLLWKLVLILF